MNEFIDSRGYKWSPFAVEFDSPEGSFEFVIWAISHEHAELQLQAVRETGRVSGQIVRSIAS